jgi:hypothetical protein
VPGYTGSPGMNYPVGPGADLVGRYFTVGFRINTSEPSRLHNDKAPPVIKSYGGDNRSARPNQYQ